MASPTPVAANTADAHPPSVSVEADGTGILAEAPEGQKPGASNSTSILDAAQTCESPVSEAGLPVAKLSATAGDELRPSKQRAERPTSVVPPFWQHNRQASRVSVASSLGAIGIRLEDNTNDEQEDGPDTYDDEGGPKSPLWARHVDIDDHVRIEGDVRGVGGYTVWLVKIETLDGRGSIVLRKRYSEFEALRESLEATFPNAGSALPPLPPKSVLYKFRPNFLEKRRIGLKYFLTCVLLNPEFSGSATVRDFVFE